MSSTHTSLHVHVVFSTKDRMPAIDDRWRDDLHRYLSAGAQSVGATPMNVGGVADHVHLLIGLKPTHTLSTVMRELKKSSSIWVHQQMSFPRFQWQEGYGAFSVCQSNLARVARYIDRQEEHHAVRTFQQEYRQFLEQHEIVFNERYLW